MHSCVYALVSFLEGDRPMPAELQSNRKSIKCASCCCLDEGRDGWDNQHGVASTGTLIRTLWRPSVPSDTHPEHKRSFFCGQSVILLSETKSSLLSLITKRPVRRCCHRTHTCSGYFGTFEGQVNIRRSAQPFHPR